MRGLGRLTLPVVLLTTALLAFSAATGVALFALRAADDRVDQATNARMRWGAVGDAVADEAFAEAAYRRAPGDGRRIALLQAIDEVTEQADVVRTAGDARDRGLVSYLLLLNRGYADEVRRTVDGDGSSQQLAAGPAFDAMGSVVSQARSLRGVELVAARQDRDRLQNLVAVLVPAVFVVAALSLVGSVRRVVREHRRISAQAAASENRALSDPLTRLGNREALRRALEPELLQGSGSVLMIDLDRFKPVNDEYGHEAGDLVLIAVAQRLTTLLGSRQTAVRLGGDEFAVLAPGLHDPTFLARSVVRELAAPVSLDGAEVTVGASVGAAVYPADGVTQHDLLRAADVALYAAKAAGRDCARVYSALRPDAVEASRDRNERSTLSG